MSRKGWLLFVAMGVIWGLPYLLIKIAVREISPAMLVEMRTGGGAVLLVPLAIGRGALRPALLRWRAVLLFTAVEIGLPWLLLFNAERKLSSSLAGLLVAAVPLFGVGLALLSRSDERFGARRLGGVAVGLAGVGALVGFDVGHADLLAAGSMAVVAAGYALGPWVVGRYLSEVPGLGVMAAGLAACAIAYAPAAALSVPDRSLSASVVSAVAALTLVCTALAFPLFYALIAEVGPVRSTIITYVNPAVAVLLGVTVLDERFTAATAVGFALIVAGCVLSTGRAPVTESAELAAAAADLAASAAAAASAGGGTLDEADEERHRPD